MTVSPAFRLYNGGMTLEDHLACPKCGYDLHGIPEVRCPECGFRYDAAALRSMAASAEWIRLVAARMLIVRATLAAALTIPAVLDHLGISGLSFFCVTAVAYLAAFLTWAVLTDVYTGPTSIPTLLVVLLGFGAFIRCIGHAGPWVSLAAGAVFLLLAWMVRIRYWPTLPPPSNTPSTELRRSVVRHSVAGTVLLLVASLLVVIVLVR
ncbi:MAG: hypothetical protein JSU86_12970 [Phycisphaerales bacterium]|nr:MAG: hypothetical protein JSU86_12970 [Phycisphaerales bacterium]